MRIKCKECGASMRPVFVNGTSIRGRIRLVIQGCGEYRWDCPHGHTVELSEIAKEVHKFTCPSYAQLSVQRHVLREDFNPRNTGIETYFDSYYNTYLYKDKEVI